MKDEINEQIIETMFKVMRAMKDSMCFTSKSQHMTVVQLEALIFIKKNSGIQMGELAENFSTTMPTATSLIDKLILLNLVVRKNDPKDRRIVKISLTKEGEKTLHEAMKHRKNKLSKLLSYLSTKDKVELLRILQIVVKKVNENEK